MKWKQRMFYLEYGINAKPCFETSFQEQKQEINIFDLIAYIIIIICMEINFCHYLSESNFVVSNYQEKQELRIWAPMVHFGLSDSLFGNLEILCLRRGLPYSEQGSLRLWEKQDFSHIPTSD